MSVLPRSKYRPQSQFACVAMALLLTCPASSYDSPLTESAIRHAYFLGTRRAGMGDDFLAHYAHALPALRTGDNFVSRVRIETPFLQLAAHTSRILNYNAQDALKDFLINRPCPV